jgi:hypothetical protein
MTIWRLFIENITCFRIYNHLNRAVTNSARFKTKNLEDFKTKHDYKIHRQMLS